MEVKTIGDPDQTILVHQIVTCPCCTEPINELELNPKPQMLLLEGGFLSLFLFAFSQSEYLTNFWRTFLGSVANDLVTVWVVLNDQCEFIKQNGKEIKALCLFRNLEWPPTNQEKLKQISLLVSLEIADYAKKYERNNPNLKFIFITHENNKETISFSD